MSIILPKGAPTCLASEGRLTLQVPQMSLFGSANDYTTFDEEHFIHVKCGSDKIAAGKEVPYAALFFSRKGFQHYYNDLKAAFTTSRGSWADFEKHAIDWLDKVERRSRLDVQKMTALNNIDPTPYRVAKCQEIADALKNKF